MPYVPAPSMVLFVIEISRLLMPWVKMPANDPVGVVGVQVVRKIEGEGHIARPTVLSRPVVIVAPPAVASSVAPLKVSEPRVFMTAFAGSVRVLPVVTVRPVMTV